MDKMKFPIYFVGLSKNCFENTKKNLEFLIDFNENYDLNIKIIVVDSDSDDGTKEYCRNLLNEKKIEAFREEDEITKKYPSRISRIAYCRNVGLDIIKSSYLQPSLYIPMDFDLNLFKFINKEEFMNLLEFFSKSNNIDALFPFSYPYYYDIFALRKEGWINGETLLKSIKLKRKMKIGSFIFNYLYIFRKQYKPEKFKEDLIGVECAFGGMGFYKITQPEQIEKTYKTKEVDEDLYTEHLSFNSQFMNLYIKRDWLIEAPLQHIRYKSFSLFQKAIYILKTFKYDLLQFNK